MAPGSWICALVVVVVGTFFCLKMRLVAGAVILDIIQFVVIVLPIPRGKVN